MKIISIGILLLLVWLLIRWLSCPKPSPAFKFEVGPEEPKE